VRGRLRSQGGQATVELLGALAWLVLTALFVWQVLLVGQTMNAAQNAARTGSRALALGAPGQAEQAALQSLRKAYRDRARVSRSGETVRVRVRVPVIVPGLGDVFTITEEATLPG
jgi:hypothetical protein